jgi:succinylglutamic semialdehyde dehydrogenase
MGGVISLEAAQNMLAAQQNWRAWRQGAAAHAPARPALHGADAGIVDVTGIEVPDEEYFGPLLTVIRYDDFPEAIRLANQTRYGLAVG